MERKFYFCVVVVLVLLALGCSLVGGNAESSTGQNHQGNAETQVEDARAARAEAASLPPRVGTLFRGLIGDAKIEMDIKRDGETLAGNYYYLKSGSTNRLTLKGKVGSDSTFTMQEFDSAGKQTGEFKGTWKQEPNEAGATLEGTWKKPNQPSEQPAFYATEQMVYFSTTGITTREIKEAVKAKKATLSAEYPELSGGENVAGFNQLAKARVMRSLRAFKKDLAGVTAEDISRMRETGNYIDIGYDVEYADEGLISVNFGEDTYTGGAHPNHNAFTITYDLKAARELKLADLFKPGSKYLATIADYAIRDLKERQDPESGENYGLAQDIFEDGAKPTADNYRNWNITKKGLLITFPPYQVGAYAFGRQTVIVPYSQLKDIARPDSPLEKARS
jgi:hypothetical protein